ncbi:hypothetical protein Ahy_B09g098644 [Arachis hypogaea]|uniref:Uncharacterized protein n=1 Tax=Arachis hypogaea TaxID=3818 RepID=A0A444XRQ0_ARAHY|nr:hypothetical protein Ahy_B09g098644 [Arachis hypogaea]
MGIVTSYKTWVHHGESLQDTSTIDVSDLNEIDCKRENDSATYEMLYNIFREETLGETLRNFATNVDNNIAEEPHEETKRLRNFYYTNPCSSLGSPISSLAALISAPAIVPFSSCIGKRGSSHGIAINRVLKIKTNEKLELSISLDNLAPNGIHADLFASEVSIVISQNAPLDVEKWSQIENDVKQKICDIVLGNICYRSWRSRLHEHYELYQIDEEHLQNSPNIVLPKTGENLVCYFRSPSFQRHPKTGVEPDI